MLKHNIAYCGDDCQKCPAYIATQHNDDALRKQVVKLWSHHFSFQYTDVNCHGCRSTGMIFFHCQNCHIKNCCIQRDIDNCSFCTDFETCNELKKETRQETYIWGTQLRQQRGVSS